VVEGSPPPAPRRKLEELTAPVAGDEPAFEALIGENARERLTAVKRGLQSILELLAGSGADEFRLAPPAASAASSRVRALPSARVKASRGKASTSRSGPARPPQAHRKRSA